MNRTRLRARHRKTSPLLQVLGWTRTFIGDNPFCSGSRAGERRKVVINFAVQGSQVVSRRACTRISDGTDFNRLVCLATAVNWCMRSCDTPQRDKGLFQEDEMAKRVASCRATRPIIWRDRGESVWMLVQFWSGCRSCHI
jgi:hypothetical protein